MVNPDEIYEQQFVFIPATEGAGGESDSWGTGSQDNIVFVFFVFVFAYVCICIWQKGEKQKVVKATVVVFWNTDNIGVLLLLFLNAAFVVCI